MTELNALLTQWHGTLLQLTHVYGSASDIYRTNLTARTDSIAKLSHAYREALGTPRLLLRPARQKIPGAGAIAAASAALEQLDALIDIGGRVEYAQAGQRESLRKFWDIQSKLHLRWVKLFDLRKDLRKFNIARYEMEACVPVEFYAPILRKNPDTRPPVSPEQAEAIIMLYHSGIEASYVAASVEPFQLDEAAAQRVLGMYREGIPSEFGSALV